MKSFLTKNFYLILIVLLAFILRVWNISSNPPGLYVDEVSFGYNAYSLLKTGRDEYGNFLPLTIRSFDDYKAPLYAYLLIPSIAIFGLSEFAVRFPSALLGTLTIPVVYFLVKKLFKSKLLALVAAFSLAISPWHLQFSRAGFEANIMLFFEILGITLFLYSRGNQKLLIAAAASFGLAFNSYHAARIWIPFFLVCLIYIYRHDLLKIKWRLVLPVLTFIILVAPTVLNFQSAITRGKAVSIFHRGNLEEKLTTGYLSHFSPNFLFIAGDTIGRHSVPGMGHIYIAQLPLVILGLISLIKENTKRAKLLLSWLILSPLPAAIAEPTPHALRFITVIPLWSIFSAYGFSIILSYKKQKTLKRIILSALAVVFLYNLITYLHLYHVHYPKEKGPDWSVGYKEMLTYVKEIENDYSTVAISNYYGWPYIYTLFYTKFDPFLYQGESWDKTRFDKYEFFGASWEKTKQGKALVVTPYWQAHPEKVLKEIRSSNGDLVFRISETE